MGVLARVQRSFGCDLRTLALFRVNLGLLIIVDLVLRTRDFSIHYTDVGILPRADLLGVLSSGGISLHMMGGGPLVPAILFVLAGAVALALIVGYRTRIATVLSWFLLLSLQYRNSYILQGGDQLLLLLLFWGMFLPLGARFSIDQALSNEAPATRHDFFSAGTVALLIQCMCVYFFSAFLKSAPSYIPDGTAVYETMQLENYSSDLAPFLLNFPTLMKGLTYYVWVLELVGPILIFAPFFFLSFRLAFMVMFITMHIGFILFMEIGLFPYISITSLLAFTPAATWDWLARRLERGGSQTFQVFYDGGCDFCRKLCLGFRTFLMLPGMQILPAQEHARASEIMAAENTWVVVGIDGATRTKSDALRYVLSLSPVFWSLSRLWKDGSRRGELFYAWVAARRQRFSKVSASWFPYRDNPIDPTWSANLVVALLLAIILHANVKSIDIPLPSTPLVDSVYATLRLYQNWNMFAPAPASADYWLVPIATLRNGVETDVRGESIVEPNVGLPSDPRGFYPTYRQRKYAHNILSDEKNLHRPLYGQFFCRQWNARNFDEFQIEDLKIIALVERTQPDYQPTSIDVREFWSGKCAAPEEEEKPARQEGPMGEPGTGDINADLR